MCAALTETNDFEVSVALKDVITDDEESHQAENVNDMEVCECDGIGEQIIIQYFSVKLQIIKIAAIEFDNLTLLANLV